MLYTAEDVFMDFLLYETRPVSRVSYLRHVEQQRDGVVEVGVGATGVDPEMPEDREQSRAGEQDAGYQEDVPQD